MFKSITNIFEKKKWMYTPKEGEQFFFMHIPKTGGTTFRKMIVNHFPDECYYPSQQQLKDNDGKYLSQNEIIDKHKNLLEKSCLSGHYSIDLITQLHPNVKAICFFRDPIERAISHINHLRIRNNRFKELSISEILNDNSAHFVNQQIKMLGWNGENHLDNLIGNLGKFAFVGLSERFDEGVGVINKIFDWNLTKIEQQNKTSLLHYVKFSEETREELRSKLALEIEFYDYIYSHYYPNQLKEFDS